MKNIVEKRFLLVLLLSFIFCLFSQNLVNSEVTTSAEITNSPPILSILIPDQFWPTNESLTDSFNLNDYFFDPNGDEITFNSSSVQNITVIISSNGSVSFFPDISFKGLRNITFSCSDGNHSAEVSNYVLLNVGMDDEAPMWHSPEKNKVNVSQNSIVNFSTIWTDNIRLREFIFSINQGTGWVNYSTTGMKGIYNVSRENRIQISAPGGTNVSWRFYAYDLMRNMGVTDIQTFLVSFPPISGGADSESGIGGAGSTTEESEDLFSKEEKKTTKDFSLDFTYSIITLYPGEGMTKILRITNIGTQNISFNLFEQNLKKFMTLSETTFTLGSAQTKEITLDFNLPDNFPLEQYFGFLVVNSSAGYKKIPIVLNLKQRNPEFDVRVNISDKYSVTKPGKDVFANISLIFSRDIKNQSFVLYYAIKDINGNVIEFREESVDRSFSEIERSLSVPVNSVLGQYIFYARLSDEEKLAIDSQIFEVGSRIKLAAFLKYGSLIFILSLVSFLILLLVYRYNQKKEKARILRLYLLLNELKNLVKEENYDGAINLYLRLKSEYNEIVPSREVANKETLKEEIKKISEYLNKKEVVVPEESDKKDDKVSGNDLVDVPGKKDE